MQIRLGILHNNRKETTIFPGSYCKANVIKLEKPSVYVFLHFEDWHFNFPTHHTAMPTKTNQIIVLLLWDLSWIANTKPMTQFERVTNVFGFFCHERTVNDKSIFFIFSQSKQSQDDNAERKEIENILPASTIHGFIQWKLKIDTRVSCIFFVPIADRRKMKNLFSSIRYAAKK